MTKKSPVGIRTSVRLIEVRLGRFQVRIPLRPTIFFHVLKICLFFLLCIMNLWIFYHFIIFPKCWKSRNWIIEQKNFDDQKRSVCKKLSPPFLPPFLPTFPTFNFTFNLSVVMMMMKMKNDSSSRSRTPRENNPKKKGSSFHILFFPLSCW